VKQLNQFGLKKSVIVVDNHSMDDSVQFLKDGAVQCGFSLIINTVNSGYAAGNNLGLKEARQRGFQYALILNSDIEFYELHDIEKMFLLLENNDHVACVSPRVVNPDGSEAPQRLYRPSPKDFSWGIFSFESKLKKKTQEQKGDFPIYRAHGSCMMVRLSVMEDVGYFYEKTFLYFEESILAEKMLRHGYKTYCSGNSRVLHSHSAVTKKFLKKWRMLKIYAGSANIYMGYYLGWKFPQKQVCVCVKSLSMLKGWLF
jgi:GT2 family glycosyltransferase